MKNITLNNFAEKALKRVSPIYENSRFMKNFFKATGAPFDVLRPYFLTLREQSFNSQVDWGIDYREEMYSLPHRTDLTLPERRALLKIKATRHYPLNPARLEQFIKDNFDFKVYLSEREAGFIRLIFNYVTPDAWTSTVEWLLEEKPAHLSLASTYHIIITPGGSADGDPTGDDDFNSKIDPPAIYPVDPPTPTSDDDKKKFRRIFAGVGEVFSGNIFCDIKKPSHDLKKICAGIGIYIEGSIIIGKIPPPEENDIRETPLADILIADWGVAR